MPLPDKAYVYLPQLMRRWQTDMADLRDYAEQGQLEIQIWLDESIVKVYRLKKTEDGEIAPVSTGIINYKGYVILEPFKVRRIFREQKAMIHKFTSLDRKELFKLPQSEGCPVSVDDLMVSRAERDRFEIANQITPINGSYYPGISPDTKTGIVPISAGRPSIMKRITEQHLARVAKGEALSPMTAEARYLRGWARDAIPGAQIPAAKTILNNLSSKAV
jgi:hypothetical protein